MVVGNLAGLDLDLASVQLPEHGELLLALTNDRELRLHFTGLPVGAELRGEVGWARAYADLGAGGFVLTVEPSDEARTCSIAY